MKNRTASQQQARRKALVDLAYAAILSALITGALLVALLLHGSVR
jgi:hypothetical protein